MRTARVIAGLAFAVAAISACGTSTSTTSSPAAPATPAPPPTTAATTAGQTLRHLRPGAAITQDDSSRDFAITDGDRAELRLSDEYTWTEPQIAGPAELQPITPPDDGGYVAWELVTLGPGNLIISATGTPNCDEGDCNLEEFAFAVSIAVRRR